VRLPARDHGAAGVARLPAADRGQGASAAPPLVRAKDALALVQAYREGTLDREQLETRLRTVAFEKAANAPAEEIEFCPTCGLQDGQPVSHAELEAHVTHAVARALRAHEIADHGRAAVETTVTWGAW
jgi:hypothetical protein